MIRKAKKEDVEPCVALAIGMIAEGYYKGYGFNQDKMIRFAEQALNDEGSLYLVYQASSETEVAGFFLGNAVDTFFGDDIVAEQQLMYIDPSHRGSIKVAMTFMSEFRNWAKRKGCKDIFFAPTVSVHEGFNNIAKRLGYEYIGPMFGRAV